MVTYYFKVHLFLELNAVKLYVSCCLHIIITQRKFSFIHTQRAFLDEFFKLLNNNISLLITAKINTRKFLKSLKEIINL